MSTNPVINVPLVFKIQSQINEHTDIIWSDFFLGSKATAYGMCVNELDEGGGFGKRRWRQRRRRCTTGSTRVSGSIQLFLHSTVSNQSSPVKSIRPFLTVNENENENSNILFIFWDFICLTLPQMKMKTKRSLHQCMVKCIFICLYVQKSIQSLQ